VIDLHSHIAWGYDDGAVDADESTEMARMYAEQGVEVVAATPHVTFGWADPPTDLDERCAALSSFPEIFSRPRRLSIRPRTFWPAFIVICWDTG